jgi:hypothetical protein
MHLSSSAPVTCPSGRRRPIAAVRRDEHDTAWLTGRARARASPPIGMRLAIPELQRQVAHNRLSGAFTRGSAALTGRTGSGSLSLVRLRCKPHGALRCARRGSGRLEPGTPLVGAAVGLRLVRGGYR